MPVDCNIYAAEDETNVLAQKFRDCVTQYTVQYKERCKYTVVVVSAAGLAAFYFVVNVDSDSREMTNDNKRRRQGRLGSILQDYSDSIEHPRSQIFFLNLLNFLAATRKTFHQLEHTITTTFLGQIVYDNWAS